MEGLTTAATVFTLELPNLKTLDNQRELLTCVNRLHATFRLSEIRIQSLELQIWVHPAEIKSSRAEVNRPGAALKVVHHQLMTARSKAAAVEAKCHQNCGLIDTGVQKRQDFEAF